MPKQSHAGIQPGRVNQYARLQPNLPISLFIPSLGNLVGNPGVDVLPRHRRHLRLSQQLIVPQANRFHCRRGLECLTVRHCISRLVSQVSRPAAAIPLGPCLHGNSMLHTTPDAGRTTAPHPTHTWEDFFVHVGTISFSAANRFTRWFSIRSNEIRPHSNHVCCPMPSSEE